MLRALEGQPAPVTLAGLSAATSLHPNTLREHLENLVREGLVHRSRAIPSGRGRPAWQYSTVPDAVDPLVREYAGLAATLAAALRRHSRHPRQDAVVAGRSWGAELAAGVEAPSGRGAVARRRAVVDLLERLRFSPRTGPQARTVRLTRCPLLTVAEEYPDVVCGIHRGLVEGALNRWGDTTTDVQLVPFAEPGSCTLTMTPAGASGPQVRSTSGAGPRTIAATAAPVRAAPTGPLAQGGDLGCEGPPDSSPTVRTNGELTAGSPGEGAADRRALRDPSTAYPQPSTPSRARAG